MHEDEDGEIEVTSPKRWSPAETEAAMHDFVASLIPGGKPRKGQDEMLAACIQAIKDRGDGVFPAPTGTGKSIVLLFATLMSGMKAVIATFSRHLQDQYLRDAPMVCAFLEARYPGHTFTVATIKGRGAYACQWRIAEPPMVDPGELQVVTDWAQTTETGEWDGLWGVSAATKSALSVDSDDCLGDACDHFETCFAYKAKERAHRSDVVIANTKLWALHIRTGGAILPQHEIIALDECHEADTVVADTLGAQLRFGMNAKGHTGTIPALANAVGKMLEGCPEAERMVEASERAHQWLALRQVALDEDMVPNSFFEKGLQVARTVDAGSNSFDPADLWTALQPVVENCAAIADRLRHLTIVGQKAQKQRDKLVARVDRTHEAIIAMGRTEPGQMVFHERDRDSIVLRMIDVRIAEPLQEFAWQETPADDYSEGKKRVALMCSGTVPKGFHHKMGLSGARVTSVTTPFDWDRTRLYAPGHLPTPKGKTAQAHQEAAMTEATAIAAASLAAGKSVLMVCTSKASAAAFGHHFRRQLDVQVLTQGDAEKSEIIDKVVQAHRTGGEPMIVSAGPAFYTGVDAPRCFGAIIVDKAPMKPPNDPIMEAEKAIAKDPFRTVTIPKVAAQLGQAAGRLMRCLDDWGVVAVLDPRLRNETWARGLWSNLPDMPHAHSIAEIEAFFAAGPGATPAPAPVPPSTPAPAQAVAQPRPAPARSTGGRITADQVPAGRYAIEVGGNLVFLQAEHGSPYGKWAGWVFVKKVSGDNLLDVPKETQRNWLVMVAKDPVAAMARYGHERKQCGAMKSNGHICGAGLSDELSLSRGIGPKCWDNMIAATRQERGVA